MNKYLEDLGFTEEEQREINDTLVNDAIFVEPLMEHESYEDVVGQFLEQGYSDADSKHYASEFIRDRNY